MRRFRFVASILTTALVVLAVARSCVWTRVDAALTSLPPELRAPLRTKREHDERTRGMGQQPYFVEGDGVLVVGCRHTSKPDDPQIAALEARFRDFRPTLVLIEGRLGWAWGGRDALLASFGESGFARALAWESGTPCQSLEPPFALEVEDAVGAFDAQKTLAFYTMRVFVSDRDQGSITKDNTNREAARLLAKRASRTGLASAFADLSAFERFWREEFPKGPDWRELPAEALWRTHDGTWLGRIAERINRFRDRAMVGAIVAARASGERVFAVCGSSHAILFEPALRAALAR